MLVPEQGSVSFLSRKHLSESEHLAEHEMKHEKENGGTSLYKFTGGLLL